MPRSETQPQALKERIASGLETARALTLQLVEPMPDAELERQQSSIMSPLVWDLAHVGYVEEFWLLRTLGGREPIDARFDELYDAFQHARAERASLDILGVAAARRYIAEVRSRVLEALDAADLDDADRLRRAGFAYGMVIQHEHQHRETMLATLALMEHLPYPLPPVAPSAGPVEGEVLLPGGEVVLGTDDEPWAFDNERRAHRAVLGTYRLSASPVTNGDWMAFIASGGYDREELWLPRGWRWRVERGAQAPRTWSREGDGSWSRCRFGHREPVPTGDPVQHVCYWEADAFARFAGRRLPTEAEWEAAATMHGADKRRFPWGDDDPSPERANLGGSGFAPEASAARPQGGSSAGCQALVGDVWEWTSSDFLPYPGFEAFPYREYSEVFFGGDYKVLRGGSWATHASVARATFRNWDHPLRRQIFAGLRLAADA